MSDAINKLQASIHDPNEFIRELSLILDGLGNEMNPQVAPAELPAAVGYFGVDGVGDSAAPFTDTKDRLDDLEAKVNAIITALKSSGVFAA